MDEVAHQRAAQARECTLAMIALLRACGLSVHTPQGGYFVFADLSVYAQRYQQLGFTQAEQFLLQQARVATISGEHFAEGCVSKDQFRHFVRINCGRDREVLTSAAQRIKTALDGLC